MRCDRMGRGFVACFCLVAAWLVPTLPADAWSAAGHRIIANIAFDRLDPAVRSGIVDTIRRHEDFEKRFAANMPDDIKNGDAAIQERWIFLQASIWPDLARGSKFSKGPWHYVDMPFYLSVLDQMALEGTIKPNISSELPKPLTAQAKENLNCLQAFSLCLQGVADPNATAEERAIGYCWILHIGGDIHQPLHSTALMSRARFNTADGDRGGNSIRVQQRGNLHSLWDGLLGGNQSLNEIRSRSADLVRDPDLKAAGEKAAGTLAIEAWAKESHHLCKTVVYNQAILAEVTEREADATQPLRAVDLDEDYLKQAGKVARQRVVEAGYRLAAVLSNQRPR